MCVHVCYNHHCSELYLLNSPFEEMCNCLVLLPLSSVQFSLPNILAGCLPKLLDGSTLLLVFIPACSLAGAVTVVGKLTLGAAVQIGLVTETAVAHLSGKTERETYKAEQLLLTS